MSSPSFLPIQQREQQTTKGLRFSGTTTVVGSACRAEEAECIDEPNRIGIQQKNMAVCRLLLFVVAFAGKCMRVLKNKSGEMGMPKLYSTLS